MNRFVLILASIAGLTCGSGTMAADLPVKAVPSAPAVAVPTWTGFYAGGGFGYGMFNLGSSVTQTGALQSDHQSLGGRGWFGTVVAGFDYQFSDRWVAGLFADWDFSDIKGHWSDPYWEESGRIKQRWAWGAGGRVGYLVRPGVLSYANAGFTRTKFSQANLSLFGLPDRPEPDTVAAQTYNGWFIGGGLEAMLPTLPGWSIRTEYRVADYGARDVAILNQPTTAFAHIHPVVQTVRAELAYKFGGGSTPVAAGGLPSAPPQAYRWTGFYIGGGGGYGMFNLDSSLTENGTLRSDNQTLGGKGWFGTVVAGFDYRLHDRWVAGLFADVDFSDIKGHWADPYWERSGSIKQRWAWSVGGRLGYLVYPDVLAYVNGGFAQAHFTQANLFDFGRPSEPVPDVLAAQTYSGWFIGGGVESMLGILPGWSVRSEYRLAEYGAKDVPILNISSTAVARIEPVVQSVRTAIVYRFGADRVPVVTKY